ncbi:hypothetical protein DSECCO2_399330 [anaerobic digester metagenome]
MNVLVGYTGFVGSNLKQQLPFDLLCNSKNISEAYGTNPEMCIYAGVPSAMFLANRYPEEDLSVIKAACENIRKINPKKLVLISSVAVYDETAAVDERHLIQSDSLTAYGKNRLYLERWVTENLADSHIIRLPAIYGENLKKNFIYDLIHISPQLLTVGKFEELCSKDDYIKEYYFLADNGFYTCTNLQAVKPYFQRIGFSALNFTDSRSQYQFYDLARLGSDIAFTMNNGIQLLNITTEPVSAAEVHEFVYGTTFENFLSTIPYSYDIRTQFSPTGYFESKQEVLQHLKGFIGGQTDERN